MKRIALIRFALRLSDVDVDPIESDIVLLQILLQGKSVVSRFFDQDSALIKWSVTFYRFEQLLEADSAVLEGQGWTCTKILMLLQKVC
jgi:hypothetical protein